jgi:NAD(P)H dehydrogenase (quinone)
MEALTESLNKSLTNLAQVGEMLGIHNLDPDAGRIFVTGGTGIIGHRVALKLLHAGYPQVRLGTSKLELLEEMGLKGAEIADFSWDREDTYANALKDVKSVLCTVAYTKDWMKHFPIFLEACKMAGVKHFVKLSFYNPHEAFNEVPLVKMHSETDKSLIETVTPHSVDFSPFTDVVMEPWVNMGFTILKTSHFMSNVFQFQNHEIRDDKKPATFYGASGNKGVNYVSPNDIAEVAVRVLLEPRAHYNRIYKLTGPGAITDQEVADLLSKHLQKPIMYVDQPLHQFTTEIMLSGDPGWVVQDLSALEKVKSTGMEETPAFVSTDIEKICGHGAQTFEDYLQTTDTMTKMELGADPALKPLKELWA